MPSAITVDIDLYCTHGDLLGEVTSARKLQKLTPPDTSITDPTRPVRQQVLRDVLKSLANRTPPISESMLSDRTDLKDAIVYGTLMRLYRDGMTVEGDTHYVLYKDFRARYESELRSLRVSVSGVGKVSNTVTIHRR